MMGKTSGVTTKLLAEQRKGLIHSQGHSLSLAVKCFIGCCKILCEIMATVRQVCILVKYSPKPENIVGRMQENLQETVTLILINFQQNKSNSLDCTPFLFSKDHWQLLLCWRLWSECLKQCWNVKTRPKTIGRKALMKIFNFFLGLYLAQWHYSSTDNFFKTLQR